MHAHGVAGQAQRARGLVGELGHLDRSPDVEDSRPCVPPRGDAEGFDRHGRAAAPHRAEGDPVLGVCERLLDRAPYELAVVEHVRAVRRMDERRPRGERFFGVRSEEHTSELQSPCNLVCRLLLEKKKKKKTEKTPPTQKAKQTISNMRTTHTHRTTTKHGR